MPYVYGEWLNPFQFENTVLAPFHISGSDSVNATFMRQTGEFYYVESNEMDAKLLRLPFKVYNAGR